ncbi:MAG: hypothetical protein MUC49_19405 [Raineya sp.]|jgi:hypothetical protein|nr:hypothetical protein [Raineya sp.]
MLRVFIICVISILGITSKAQNTEKFIEVYVQDEILIEPDEIEFSCFIFPNNLDDDYDDIVGGKSKKDAEINEKAVYEDLEKLIKKYKFSFKKEEFKVALASGAMNKELYTYVISCKNFKEFLKFEEDLGKMPIRGEVTNKKTSQYELYEKKLVENLIKTAFKKANLIGQASNQKIIEIMQIKDVSDVSDSSGEGSWVVYPQLSSRRQKVRNYGSREITIKKTFLVRFQVENIK